MPSVKDDGGEVQMLQAVSLELSLASIGLNRSGAWSRLLARLISGRLHIGAFCSTSPDTFCTEVMAITLDASI